MKSVFLQPRAVPLAGAIQQREKKPVMAWLSTVVWLTIVFGGLWFLSNYANSPGVEGVAPDRWPGSSRIKLAATQPTLIMIVHPHCPCTRASLGELASIMAHSDGRLTAYVIFVKPQGVTADWVKTDLWDSAAAIPGVKPIVDVEGYEAHVFHASTSGQTLLYDAQGRLLFSGGITASRGHYGDNVGESAIVSLLHGEVPGKTETNVFGCPLLDANSNCRVSTDEADSECRVPINEVNKP